MDGFFITYCIFAGAGLLISLLTLVQTWEHRRYHRKRFSAHVESRDLPPAIVYVPCKGVDLGFEENLHALFTQDYPDYQLCFILEADTDPARAVIDRVNSRFPAVKCRVVVAGLATDCGQKVHNLIVATADIPVEAKVLAFADSDACPGPLWLARMIRRTANSRTGVVTGYRWFVPQRNSLSNLIVAAMNNQLAGNLGLRLFNLVWGGSWAMRKEVFEQLSFPDAWHGCLNDDLIVTQRVREARYKVVYEPHCLVASSVDMSFPALLEFARRQYFQVRVYTPRWWWLGLTAAGMAGFMYFGSLLWAVKGLLVGGPVAVPVICMAAYYTAGMIRTAMRHHTIRPFLQTDKAELRSAAWFEILALPVTALFHLIAVFASAFGRRIVWRGIHYYVAGPNRTRIEHRESPTVSPQAPSKAA